MHLVLLGTWETISSNRLGVSIAGCYVPLGCCFVAVSTPGGYEGGEVAIVGVEEDAMVAIPAVKDRLFGIERAWWNGLCV